MPAVDLRNFFLSLNSDLFGNEILDTRHRYLMAAILVLRFWF